MNIIEKLNEKLSKYKSPKVNWLTKKPWLLQLVGSVSALALFGVLIKLIFVLLSFTVDMNLMVFLLSIMVGSILSGSVPLLTLLILCNMETPKKEKVVEKYTNLILKNFAESEYHDVKIKLLKILNNEPHTPVYFLDEMVRLKEIADQQRQKEADRFYVDNPLSLTVLIEQIQKNESADQIEIKAISEEKVKNIFKL